jgi:hypothetical protein
MGIAKQKLTKDQKSSKKSHHKQPRPPAIVNRRTGRKPRDITDNERTSPAVNTGATGDESMSPTPEPEPGPPETGERLRTAIVEEVSLDYRRIARAMVKNTIDGNMSVARLLVDLTGARARKPRDLPVKKPRRKILPWRAVTLGAEPDWKGPTEAEEDKLFAKTLETAV